MKLVDTDNDRPDDEAEPAPHPNPPRPEKRLAHASLILTAVILIGTVVTIYTVFPRLETDAVGTAIRGHRAPEPAWQLVAPGQSELAAWALAHLGDHPPLPRRAGLAVVGARPIALHHRRAALVRYKVGADEVSMLVERGADASTTRGTRVTGSDVADAWRDGPWTIVVVGPAATAETWRAALAVP